MKVLSFGLAFCKRVAENHLGSIEIAPAKPFGTVVTLLLPLHQRKCPFAIEIICRTIRCENPFQTARVEVV
jgi:hypothetical protein